MAKTESRDCRRPEGAEKIRMIATDLDGTLLTSEKELTARTRAALEAAAAAGIEIVPATGRILCGLPGPVRELPFLRYAVTVNGAAVCDVRSGETLYEATIDTDTALAVLEYFDTLPVIYDAYIDGQGYMPAAMYESAAEFVRNPHSLKLVYDLRRPVPDLKAFIAGGRRRAQKIQLFSKETGFRDIVIPQMRRRFPSLAVSSSMSANIEVNSGEAGKDRGLLELAARLGIRPSEILAFGDEINDIPMLRAAGCGVAMGNGCDEAKAAADAVAPGNDSDGVAWVIDRLLKGGCRADAIPG